MKRLLPYLRYLWHITDGYHRTAILRTLLGVIRVGVVLAFIWLSKTAIDCATGRVAAETATLVAWFALMVVCLLADVLLSQWVRYLEARSTMLMDNSVNRRLFNVLMTMPLVNGQQGFHSGDMLNRLTLDVRTVSTFALSQLPAMVVMMVQLLAAFAFLAWLNPYLALAPVLIMPVCMLGSKLYFRRNRRLTADIRQGESDMHVSIQEGLKHRMVLRSLECIDVIDHRIGDIQQQLDTSNRSQTRLSAASATIVRLGFIIGYLTAFGWSIFSLKAGIITFGTMTAFIQLVNRIQHPIAGIAGYIPTFVSTSVAIDRLREIDVRTEVPSKVGMHHGASAPYPS
ncbi:MAG: ABC transporter ATP-binding protein, partial [Muribaculum sp.]|nr:ABC transporter ATP-binding protein [Muribaculum sp.]